MSKTETTHFRWIRAEANPQTSVMWAANEADEPVEAEAPDEDWVTEAINDYYND